MYQVKESSERNMFFRSSEVHLFLLSRLPNNFRSIFFGEKKLLFRWWKRISFSSIDKSKWEGRQYIFLSIPLKYDPQC